MLLSTLGFLVSTVLMPIGFLLALFSGLCFVPTCIVMPPFGIACLLLLWAGVGMVRMSRKGLTLRGLTTLHFCPHQNNVMAVSPHVYARVAAAALALLACVAASFVSHQTWEIFAQELSMQTADPCCILMAMLSPLMAVAYAHVGVRLLFPPGRRL